jgi:hypothetical protein
MTLMMKQKFFFSSSQQNHMQEGNTVMDLLASRQLSLGISQGQRSSMYMNKTRRNFQMERGVTQARQSLVAVVCVLVSGSTEHEAIPFAICGGFNVNLIAACLEIKLSLGNCGEVVRS